MDREKLLDEYIKMEYADSMPYLSLSDRELIAGTMGFAVYEFKARAKECSKAIGEKITVSIKRLQKYLGL